MGRKYRTETTMTPMHAPSIHLLQKHRSTRPLDSTKYRKRRSKPRFDAIFHCTARGRRRTLEGATRKGTGAKIFIAYLLEETVPARSRTIFAALKPSAASRGKCARWRIHE
jgi:hypothetical protein